MAAEGQQMMAPEGVNPSPNITPMASFLAEEELLQIPENVRLRLYEWSAEVGNNVNNFRLSKDSDVTSLRNSASELESQIRTLENEVSQSSRNLEETGQKYRASVGKIAEVEESALTFQRQAAESQLKADISGREKDELVFVVNKRNEEIERLADTVRNLSDQLQSATVSKIEALVKVDELSGKDLELEYKEKQLEREKEWIGKQVQLLTDELDKKQAEIVSVQRDHNLKHLELSSELSEKDEQIRIAELSLENIKKTNEAQEKHIEHLINKLRDAEDIETKMQENYRQELSSQRKIAELYKESSEEASKKVEEMEDAVSSLQDLVKNATTRYGELETKFINTCKCYQDEVAERDDKISNIKKELENANKLIENFQNKGLTDEMIHSLSPAAAAATSMLKNTKSLTQIYSEYHDLANEVIIKKQESVKLNQMVKELLQEIQTQGPELDNEKIKNQKNSERIEILQTQLDLAIRESGKAKSDSAHLTKTVGALDRENGRLRAQLNDLAMQVRSLLKETEVQRGNYSAIVSRVPISSSSGVAEVPDIETTAQQVVTNRLVTFKNIEELQMQNQRLLAVVRELSESQEKATREAHENQLQVIKDSFEEAMRELEVLREKRLTQEKLLETVSKQRDTLSELLKQQKSPVKVSDPGTAHRLAEIQRQYEYLQTSHKSLQEEYETYKKESGEHEKLAVEQTEKLRDDVMKMRTDNAKLASQVDYNNERTKIYNTNLETYKKNINMLEERNKKLSATTLKFEQSLDLMKTELSNAHQKLARTEVALNSMVQERNALRDTNSRLQAERDVLKRDQSTQQMLRLNLQEIKNGLNLSNSATKSKLESDIDNLQQENNILRRKISTETERFKEAVFSWESANKELIERLRKDQDSLQGTKEQLEDSKATIARLNGEISDLQSQVKVLSDTTLETVNASNEQPVTIPALERQIKDLQNQLRDARIENETLGQHLLLAKQNAEEYRTLCASVEGQISTVSETSKQLTEELQQRLEGKDDVIRELQSRLSNSEKEGALLKDEKTTLARDLQSKTITLDEEINRMRRDLQAANSKLQTAYEENVRVKMDLEKQTLIYKDILDKYEREQAAHHQDLSVMTGLKDELETVQLRISEEEQSRRSAENQLNQAGDDWTSKENMLKTELSQLKESKNELEIINTSLQDQILNMTTRMDASNKPAGEGGDGEEGAPAGESGESSDSQKSSEQWLQLIRYLRREKEIAKTKTEMAEAACSRYENQMKHLEKQAEDLRKELSELKDTSHVSIITSAKQADLLRRVETLSALTDSNRMLREQREDAVKELQQLKEHFSVIEVEIGPLREKSSELEGRCEALLNENTSLKQDVGRWRTRASTLLAKSNKINPEEMKKLQTENDNLTKQVQMIQETGKKQQMEIARHIQQIKLLQQQTAALQQNNQGLQNEKKTLLEQEKKSGEEKERLRAEMQGIRLEVSSLKNSHVKKDEDVENLNIELENVNKLLEESRNTVKTVKNIARRYKKQAEDLQKEKDTGGSGTSAATGQPDVADESAAALSEEVESLKEDNSKYEAQVKQLQEEIDSLKKETETVKTDRGQADERLKNVLKTLRAKLTATATQKTEVEGELNEARAKISSLEVTSEESSSRLAALKSQYEGRIGRLEKENKDLKAATESASGNASEVILALQQKNDEQKKELDMLKQRLAAVENRFKMQSQTTKVVSPEKVLPVEKAKANIRPIPGTSPKPGTVARPPLTASIRPISMTRKATVSVVSAMPTQTNQQASSSNVQSGVSAAVVAPVSQAQVSTSTPDQSSSSAPESSPQQQVHQMTVNATGSGAPISSQIRQAAAVQPTVTVAPVAVGSASVVVGVSGSSAGPASSGAQASSQNTTGMGGSENSQSQQSSSTSSSTGGSGPSTGVGSNNDTQPGHQDPSTSSGAQMLEESEMGDSSEQVSSSEGSTHQNILSVAPLRSKQHEVQQSSSSTLQHQQPQPGPSKKQGSSSTEEPSPSSSSLRPSQSTNNKRLRDDDPHHDEEEDILNEPDNKRTRVMGSIDREAEALGQQESSNDQMLEEEEEEEEDEREADQGSSSAVDDAQVQRSDTTTMKSGRNDEDDDSDVIVIESDDEDGTGEVSPKATTSGGNKSNVVEEDDVDEIEEEEDVVEDEEPEDDDDIMDEDDDVDEDDDDDHGDDDGQDGKKLHVDYEEMEGQEGREAESLEHDDDDIREVHGEGQDDSQDILDSNDSLNPVDFSHDQGHQQHELREAEQSIDDEGDDGADLVPEPIAVAPIQISALSPIRPPRDLSIGRPQISSPMRVSPAVRSSVPPLLGRQQQMLTPQMFSSGPYSEDADDSIVPGTPTLYVPRRSDGFAEAVSSPQIQPGGRFTFGSMSANEEASSGTHGGTNASSSGGPGMEDTRIDFLGYDDGGSGTTGRSVPSTPLQVSPPESCLVEGVELTHEMQAVEDAAQEEGISAPVVDVQPTSSSIASVSGSDIPAITVTSAMDLSPGMPYQAALEGRGTLEAARLAALSSQPRTSTHTEVSSVTSSDEDKVPVALGTSSTHMGTIQQPSTSTSSRAASPTTSSNSSNLPTEQKEPVPQPQQQQQHHHHHHQSGRPRPLPIVWDQPSSSSSSNPAPRPMRGGIMMGRGGQMPVRHMVHPDQGHIMPPMARGYRQPLMRGAQNQSARRSRPHHRGGPGPGAGGAGAGGAGLGGSIGSRMPFQKPY